LRDLEELQIEVRATGAFNQMNRSNQASVHFDLYDRIIKAQVEDTQLKKVKETIKRG